MKLVMYITAPEPISAAYCIILLISLCLYVYPPIVARQRLGIYVTATTNTGNKRKISGGVVFYAVRVEPREVGGQFF
jgi:hypothetical protein